MAPTDKIQVHNAVLFVNTEKENADTAAAEIKKELAGRKVKTSIFYMDECTGSLPKGRWDIAFSLGGDGTVLYAARMLSKSNTPILPLHLGTLGFIANVERNEWLSVYEKWLKGEAKISPRCMLDVNVRRKNHSVYRNTCLNDAVISSMGIAKLINLGVKTETAPGKFTELGYYRSDGLIISTPTGSTAHSMAAGGPLLDPEMEAQILSPICPFTLSNRPMVLPSRQILLITVEKEQRSGVLLTIDGQDTHELKPDDTVTVCHSQHYTQLITGSNTAYYSALRDKLGWCGKRAENNNA